MTSMSVTVIFDCCYSKGMGTVSGLRDVSRRAIRGEIIAVAESLFMERGYDATTVDQIAERVGMSQRTFFRYIGSKEDLVLAHYERLGEDLAARLKSQPHNEDAWSALRGCFEVIVEQRRDEEAWKRGALAQSIVESTPTLLAAYLERMDSAQETLTSVLQQRQEHGGDWPLLRALVGSAFAALQAVVTYVGTDAPAELFEMQLDRVMSELRPGAA